MSIKETREDGDPGEGVRDPRDAEPRSEVADTGAGDPEAQAGGHAELPQANVSETKQRHVVSAVRRTVAVAQLPGKFRATTASVESTSELCDGVPG